MRRGSSTSALTTPPLNDAFGLDDRISSSDVAGLTVSAAVCHWAGDSGCCSIDALGAAGACCCIGIVGNPGAAVALPVALTGACVGGGHLSTDDVIGARGEGGMMTGLAGTGVWVGVGRGVDCGLSVSGL